MSYSVLFSLLPNGFTESGLARLSLVASPRPPAGPLGASEVMHWPEIVAGLGPRLLVQSPGGAPPVEATVVSPPPSQALWSKLFSPGTPVHQAVDPLSGALSAVTESQPYTEELALVKTLYQQALTATEITRGHPVMQVISGLNAWRPGATGDHTAAVNAADILDLLDPKKVTRERTREAMRLLRVRGHSPVADVAALIPGLRRIALTRAVGDGAAVPPAPGPLDAIPEADNAHFSQVIGALMRHPKLALLLGLRVDLTMQPFTGGRLIRLTRLDGRQLNGTEPLPQPWSAVVSDPANGRFVMATQPDPRAEVVNGMLDVRPETGDGSRYALSDVDVTAIALQLDVIASGIAGSGTPAMPVRRTSGFALAQTNRNAGRFRHMLERNARFEGPSAFPDEVEGAPVLYADDVTTGYRVDVSMDGGRFRSLMRRIANYRIGSDATKVELTATDEGLIDAVVLTQQHDFKGKAHVFVGEELFLWTGWGFGGGFPGAVADAETDESPDVAIVDAAPLPGYPLLVKTAVEPGTLTPLRFGRKYRFRARVVDLAGNSVEPERADPAYTTVESPFLRTEAVASPIMVARHEYRPGESLTHLVVTSDGAGTALSTSERHLAAPKSTQQLAELHGKFDRAFGPNVAQAERDAAFELARREEGSFLDPAEGAYVAGSANPTPLPVPRGEPLAPGEYMVHDTEALRLPYLPEVPSSGAALTGLPATSGPVIARWGLGWPDSLPARLVARPGQTGATTVETQNGRAIVYVDVPPATKVTARLSSAIHEEVLDVMYAPAPGTPARRQAAEGQLPLLSPRQEFTLVHAVKKPLTEPTMSGLDVQGDGPVGTTAITARATVGADSVSTGKIALEATWTETVDRGYGPVETEERRVVLDSAVFQRGDSALPLEGKHDFGDSKHRAVRFRPVSGTRFREYFEEQDERAFVREGVGEVKHLPGRIRPKPPRVAMTTPINHVTRQVLTGGSSKIFEAIHRPKGLRLYLDRPWGGSGEGELLGVVSGKDGPAADAIAANPALAAKTSVYGIDLYEEWLLGGADLDASLFTGRETTALSVQIPGINGGTDLFAIAGHEVRFDSQRGLWYSDVLMHKYILDKGAIFVRLSLVAYQEHAKAVSPNPVDIRSSRLVIADPVQMTAERAVTARVSDDGPTIQITVTGASNPDGIIRARWQTRLIEPDVWPNPAPDMCVNSSLVAKSEVPAGSNNLILTIRPPSGLSPAQLSTLRKGRIVVEEVRDGWSLSPGTGQRQERVVFTEAFDVQDIL